MKITIEGVDYELNVYLAEARGCLKKIPRTRPVGIQDIPNGSLFKWIEDVENPDDTTQLFVMRDNLLTTNGQCISAMPDCPRLCWFWHKGDEKFLFWSETDKKWVSEVPVG